MRSIRLNFVSILLVIGCVGHLVNGRRPIHDHDSHDELDPNTSEADDATDDSPRHNELWALIQPKLRTIVDSYETVCARTGAQFNRKKMDKELEACFRPSIRDLLKSADAMIPAEQIGLHYAIEALKEGQNLTSSQVRALKQLIVAPVCHFTSTVVKCFKPHYSHVLERCTNEAEGKAVEYSDLLIEAACRNNGSQIIDFMRNGGVQCLSIYADQGMACLEQNSNLLNAPDKKPETVLELCEHLGTMHGCFEKTINQCPRKAAGQSLKSVFSELKQWTSNTCLNSGASRTSLLCTQTFLLFLIPLLNLTYFLFGKQ